MIQFREFTLKDKELISNYTFNSHRRNCDLSFSNLCSWQFLYQTQFALLDGFLILKFKAEGLTVYMMPFGKGDLQSVIEKLIAYLARQCDVF